MLPIHTAYKSDYGKGEYACQINFGMSKLMHFPIFAYRNGGVRMYKFKMHATKFNIAQSFTSYAY